MTILSGKKIDFGDGVMIEHDRGSGDLKITRHGTDQLALSSGENVALLDSNKGLAGGTWRDTRTTPLYNQPIPIALNSTGTLTAAMILGGIVTSTTAAAVTATLDTGANLETALMAIYPGLQTLDAIEFSVVNTGANNFTVATATGWTNGGNAFTAVAAGTSATFRIRRSGTNTYVIYKIA